VPDRWVEVDLTLDEDEATWIMVNGFFDPIVRKLPFDIQVEVRQILELALKGH